MSRLCKYSKSLIKVKYSGLVSLDSLQSIAGKGFSPSFAVCLEAAHPAYNFASSHAYLHVALGNRLYEGLSNHMSLNSDSVKVTLFWF